MKVASVNNQYSQNFTANPSRVFAGASRVYDKVTDKLADCYKFTCDRPWLEKTSEFIGKRKWLANKLPTHLIVGSCAITSTTYMVRTLNCDKIEEDRRKILAINQGLVAATSIAGNYALDSVLDNKWQTLTDKFKEAQIKAGHTERLDAKVAGMGFLKSALLFGLIYRYIAPVIVTPIANNIGNRMLEKKHAQEVAKTKPA